MAYNCVNVPNSTFSNSSTSYADPVQGAANNCSLIASLASVAWVTSIIPYPRSLVNNNYQVWFYNPVPVPYYVPQTLWYDPAANPKLRYARSHFSTDIWPGIYEKAYALLLCGTPKCNMDEVDTAKKWPGNASPPLKHLTGLPFPRTIDPLSKDCIKPLCDSGQISRPAVMWTKSDIADGTDEMEHDHSYSVFGMYNADYVVLRNPSGQNNNQNNPNVIDEGVWQVNQRIWNCRRLMYQTGSIMGSNGIQNISLGEKGFFALKATKIPYYFAGWTYIGVTP